MHLFSFYNLNISILCVSLVENLEVVGKLSGAFIQNSILKVIVIFNSDYIFLLVLYVLKYI